MKNARDVNVQTHSTNQMAKEIENHATRLFNNASISEHNVIDASIYLSKAAEELKSGMIRNARAEKDVDMSEGITIRKCKKVNNRGIEKVIISMICFLIITTIAYKANSYFSEPKVIDNVIVSTPIEDITMMENPNSNIENNIPVVQNISNISKSNIKEEEKIPYKDNETFTKEKVIKAIKKHIGGVFKGKETYIYTNCKSYTVNPMLVTAIMKHETGNGTSKMVRNQNNPAGISTKSGGFVTYKTLDAGILSLIKLLKNYYIDRGLNSIETIGAVFCPISDVRDVNKLNSSWIPTVAKYYKEILADAKD